MLRKKTKNESSGFSFSGQAEISILWAADIRPDWCLTFHTRPVLMSLLCLCVTSVQWEYCWHRSVAPVMSGVWNSSAVSSAAPCRPALQWFYPLWAPGSIAPGLASLACYNETDMPGMCVHSSSYAPKLPTRNLLSTFWVSFKHSLYHCLLSSHSST